MAYLLAIPADPKNAWVMGYSALRITAILFLFSTALISGWTGIKIHSNTTLGKKASQVLVGDPQYQRTGTIWAFIFLLVLVVSLLISLVGILLQPLPSPWFHRFFPPVLFIFITALECFLVLKAYHGSLGKLSRQRWKSFILFSRRHNVGMVIILLLLFLSGLWGYNLAQQHASRVNLSYEFSDQKSYLEVAEKASQTGFHFKGDRNRTPLYSYTLALFYRPGMKLTEFFEKTKLVSIFLALLLFVGIFLVSHRFLPALPSAVLALTSLAGLIVYKAGYVQTDLLYYFLSFLGFVLMTLLFVRANVWLGAAAGGASALAYLAKASMLLGFAIFCAIFGFKLLVDLSIAFKNSKLITDRFDGLKRNILSLVLAIVVFLALLSPYLLENKKLFGQYFYNVNTTFYAWYDSWDQVAQGTKSHGDDLGWPDLPPDQIPSMGKYFQEHSFPQMIKRFTLGLNSIYVVLEKPYSPVNYLLVYTIILVVFCLLNLRTCLRLIKQFPFLLLFCLAFFGIYLASFAWFAPISDFLVARFVYGLYLPYLFCLFAAMDRLAKGSKALKIGSFTLSSSSLLQGIHAVMLAVVLWDLFCQAPARMDRWYGK